MAAVIRRRIASQLAAVALAAVIAACHDDRSAGPPHAPEITAIGIAANGTNVLSAIVTFTALRGDSARVSYWSEGEPVATTPYSLVRDGAGRVAVLGLRPQATYQGLLEVAGAGGTTTWELELQGGTLPNPLQQVHLNLRGGGHPPPGFLLTSVTVADTAYAIAFDSSGVIRWYRGFPTGIGEHALACEQQPDGNFTLFVGLSSGSQPVPGRYYAFTPAGDSLDTFTAGIPYYTDPHELLVRQPGVGGGAAPSIYVIGYDLRAVDLTSLGGGPSQTVAAHSILRQASDGTVEFQWSAWDHFTLDDWVARPPNVATTTQLDLDHANSIELDSAGDYIVSFAAVTQIVKIDHTTGAIRWRLGGRLNQFTYVGDPLNGFGIQHDARLLPNGDLLIFDNGNFHNPPESRAVEYHLDAQAMTATKVWEYRHSPPIYAPFVGSVQRFRNGHTLVGFGAAAVMTEVTGDGQVVWEGALTVDNQPGAIFYRVRALPSLYEHLDR